MRKFVFVIVGAFCLLGMKALADVNLERREALKQLTERAESGDPKALYDLAVLHDMGYDTIPVDSVRSTLLYRMSAEKGYAPAQNYIGFRYFNGESVKQDIDSALYWLAKAAGQGDVKASNNLGFLLSNSDVVTRDYPQAIMWLTKAADAGLPAAQGNLADLYRQGLGTEPDTVMAEKYYNKAIEGGLSDAGLKLLSMMGRKWEKLDADSAVSLGKYYYKGMAPFIGVTLFKNAALSGNADALALLGDAYSRAIGVEYDHNKSLEYFLQAALAGQPSAQFVIGELLDIFPDALDDEKAQTVIIDFYGGIPYEDVYSASYWYDKAKDAGVGNAEEATELLFRND